MAYGSKSRSSGVLYFPGFPNGVKWLLISNAAVFIVSFFAPIAGVDLPWDILKLYPRTVVRFPALWQLATYMFLHAGFGHIIWNMLALWMFGADIEGAWGTRRFLQFYFFCGIGAGICVVALNYALLPFGRGDVSTPTIGASGAIFGILMAYAMLFPTRTILFAFLIPIQVKWFVLIIGTVTFMMSFQPGNGVSSFAHLGGLLFGFLFVRAVRQRKGVRIRVGRPSLRDRYRQWKVLRNKKKFQVYLKKHGDRDRWVN